MKYLIVQTKLLLYLIVYDIASENWTRIICTIKRNPVTVAIV